MKHSMLVLMLLSVLGCAAISTGLKIFKTSQDILCARVEQVCKDNKSTDCENMLSLCDVKLTDEEAKLIEMLLEDIENDML